MMWNIFRTLAIFIVMFLIIINEIYCDDDFSSFANGKTITGEKILSRKRRYLIFPEGSSVQLVYDQIIGMVDYTNLFIFGITCALAYELPSKPTYVDDELMDLYKNGSLPLLDRDDYNISDTNLVATDDKLKTINKTTKNNNYNNYYNNNNRIPIDNYYFGDKSDNDYYKSSRLRPEQQTSNKHNYYFNRYDDNTNNKKTNKNYANSYANNKFDNGGISYANKIDEFSMSKHKPWKNSGWNNVIKSFAQKFNANNNKNNRYQYSNEGGGSGEVVKTHKIYPVLGKRSIRSASSAVMTKFENKFYRNHHRTTRQVLYKSVEKFLNAKGLDGHECVLRALCETGQKRHEEEPGTIVNEILRVIFSLPIADEEFPHKQQIHVKYDDAHNSIENCTDSYPICKHSIWSSEFIF